MSYKKQEIWQLARTLTIDIHKMTLKELPEFEKLEVGRQIRRSMKSVRSNIVEGYGRRLYQGDYLRFIVYALSSNDETLDHLETLFETNSLNNKPLYDDLKKRLIRLGIKLNNFQMKLKQSKQQ